MSVASYVCHLVEHQWNIIYVKQIEDIGPLFLCWRINSLRGEVVFFSFFVVLGVVGEKDMTKWYFEDVVLLNKNWIKTIKMSKEENFFLHALWYFTDSIQQLRCHWQPRAGLVGGLFLFNIAMAGPGNASALKWGSLETASALMAVTAGMVKAVSICIWTVLIWIKNARAPCAKHQLVSAHSDNSDCTGLTHYRARLTPSRFSTAKPAHRGNRNVLWVITRKRDHVPHLISAKHVLLRDPVIHGSSVNSHGFTAQEVSREKATGPGNSQGFMEIEGKRNHYSKLLSYNNNFCKILFESIN